MIDGRVDNKAEGTRYKITFEWTDQKVMIWEPIDFELLETLEEDVPIIEQGHHDFYIVGSWTYWKQQKMLPHPVELNLYEITFEIGRDETEEFQITRDRDWQQAVYPAITRAMDTTIPVMGPDGGGGGKNWLVRGTKGDTYTVQLRIVDAQVTVAIKSAASGEKLFESVEGRQGQAYFIAGSFNQWRFDSMAADEKKRGVYNYFVTIGFDWKEEFQMALDANWEQTLHPNEWGVLQGPDNNGHGKNFKIMGRPGTTFEVILDLNKEDAREQCTWVEVRDNAAIADAADDA